MSGQVGENPGKESLVLGCRKVAEGSRRIPLQAEPRQRSVCQSGCLFPSAKAAGLFRGARPADDRAPSKTIFRLFLALPLSLPMSVYDNVVYGPKRHGSKNKKELQQLAEKCLRAASLWDEVKDRLDASALKLSGGQQQRLCIARTLAVQPEVILFDEPCSGLDPISTAKVEEAMVELKKKYTLVLVTNNVKQASRVSDRTAFFLMGELVEIDITRNIFVSPKDKRTEDYVTGRFG